MNDAERLQIPLVGPDNFDPLWDRKNDHYFDRRGNPISMREWTSLMEWDQHRYRIVKQERLGDYFISTVWIGLDHAFGTGEPMIFESMVFWEGEEREEGDDLDEVMRRYSTEEEAIEGHQWFVEQFGDR